MEAHYSAGGVCEVMSAMDKEVACTGMSNRGVQIHTQKSLLALLLNALRDVPRPSYPIFCLAAAEKK